MRRAYTLVEVLVVVTVMGIAAALVVPSMSSAGTLRVHGAVRTLVSDLTFAQSDALAYQTRRAIVFEIDQSRYSICEVVGSEVIPEDHALFLATGTSDRYIVNLNQPEFGDATIKEVNFDGSAILVFDELGGPVSTPTGDEPLSSGSIVLTGSGSTFTISIEAYTGRITVSKDEGDTGSGGTLSPGEG